MAGLDGIASAYNDSDRAKQVSSCDYPGTFALFISQLCLPLIEIKRLGTLQYITCLVSIIMKTIKYILLYTTIKLLSFSFLIVALLRNPIRTLCSFKRISNTQMFTLEFYGD